jgi:hypothetical protein
MSRVRVLNKVGMCLLRRRREEVEGIEVVMIGHLRNQRKRRNNQFQSSNIGHKRRMSNTQRRE